MLFVSVMNMYFGKISTEKTILKKPKKAGTKWSETSQKILSYNFFCGLFGESSGVVSDPQPQVSHSCGLFDITFTVSSADDLRAE